MYVYIEDNHPLFLMILMLMVVVVVKNFPLMRYYRTIIYSHTRKSTYGFNYAHHSPYINALNTNENEMDFYNEVLMAGCDN